MLYFALLGNLISGAVFPEWDWPGKRRELEAATERTQVSRAVTQEIRAGTVPDEADRQEPATRGKAERKVDPAAGISQSRQEVEPPPSDSTRPENAEDKRETSPPRETGREPWKGITLITMLSTAHPQQPKDYALLLVWCFLAGFLERWVPDNLTRIANKGQNTDVTPA